MSNSSTPGTPRLGRGQPDGLSRPGDRKRIAADSGPAAGMPSRPGSRSGRPGNLGRGAGSPPRVARPGGAGGVSRKPQAKPVPVKSRVR